MKYRISNEILNPKKLEKDFSFCGTFTLDNVDLCVVKYILNGRGCDFDHPDYVTFNGIKSYNVKNDGEVVYVSELDS